MSKFPVEIKKKLGYIIREYRLYKFEETKKNNGTNNNPYTKENFCDDICHYHTLTKIENDYVNNDDIYNKLLSKLGYKFDVTYEEHEKNIRQLNLLLEQIFIAIEYIDDSIVISVNNELKDNYYNDCISLVHVYLIESLYSLQFLQKIDDFEKYEIELYKGLFKGLYKGLYYHLLGIYHSNKIKLEEARDFLLKAKSIYDQHNISKGVINSHIIGLYMLERNYISLVNLSLEMISYYKKTNNHKRLFHVYNYLSMYYLDINSFNQANEYHKRIMELMSKESSLIRYRPAVCYNWGLYLTRNYFFEEALEYMNDALYHCKTPTIRILIVTVIIFLMNKLKKNEKEVVKLINTNKKYMKDAYEVEILVFKYFVYKYNKNYYHKKYALSKLVPYLKSDPSKIDFLLLLYQDLYE